MDSLAREPSGSRGNTSPHSERSTPPCLQWALDLSHVLDDYEGYQLFTEFLKSEVGTDNELTFWYACKGFRAKCDEHFSKHYECAEDGKTKEEELVKLTERIVQEYIANNGRHPLCVSFDVKSDIHERLKENNVVKADIFDVIQREIETNLRIRHAQFVESDVYITYLQLNGEKPSKPFTPAKPCKSEAGSSEAPIVPTVPPTSPPWSTHAPPAIAALPAVAAPSTDDIGVCMGSCATLPHAARHSVARQNPPVGPTRPGPHSVTAVSAMMNRKLTFNTLAKTSQDRMNAMMPPSDSTKPGVPPNPYHTSRPYKPYLTTSTQDSELQSMSSEANTESSLGARTFKIAERNAIRNARQNADMEKLIPRTKRPQSDDPQRAKNNMMEEKFAAAVFRKLNHYVSKELAAREQLSRAIRKLDDHPNMSMRDILAAGRLHRVNNATAAMPPPTIDGKNPNTKNSIDESADVFDEDDEQGGARCILDAHIQSLDWGDTPKRSPMRSPGYGARRRSPPPLKPTPINHVMTSSYPSTSGFGGFGLLSQQDFATLAPAVNSSAMGGHPQPSPRHKAYPVAAAAPPSSQQQQQQQVGLASFESSMSQNKAFYPSIKPKNSSVVTSGIFSGGDSFFDSKLTGSNQSKTLRNMGASPSPAVSQKKLPGLGQQNPLDFITVVYFLPNEPTPFRTRFNGSKMDLRDFKAILPRKTSAFKYYFKSEVPNIGEVWEELCLDHDVIPFHKPNEITARVDSVE